MAIVGVRCYIRVSTDEQAEKGYSLPAQREALAAYALSQRWQVAGVYCDDGYSAKDIRRPALQALLGELQNGEIVLVHRLDRLTRAIVDLHELIRLFDRRGAMFRSATEGFLDTTDSRGRLMLNFLGVLSQWERENIIERTTFGKRKKAQMGEWGGGTPPVGYTLEAVASDKEGKARTICRMVPDPMYAHLIPLIFEQYLAGHGVRAVCRWLNDELGARTPAGRRFSDAAVSRILQNPVYCGEITYGLKRGDPHRVPSSHEPLLAAIVFESVQATFAARKESAPRRATGVYPLTGLARCGICGAAVDARRKPGPRSGQSRYYYLCHGYARARGCGTPPLTSVPGAEAEASLLQQLKRLPVPPGFEQFAAEWRAERAHKGIDGELERIRRDLAQAELAVRQWHTGLESGQLSWAEYYEQTRPHRERVQVLNAQLITRQSQAHCPPVAPATADVAKAWAAFAADLPARKALLQHFTRAWGLSLLLYPDRQVRFVRT